MRDYAKRLLVAAVILIAGADAAPSAWAVQAARLGLAPARPAGAVDMFIKIDGVEGESTDAAHENWIDVVSVSWGSGNRSPARTAGGGPGTLTLTRRVDRASAGLGEACTGGRSLGRVVLHERSGRGTWTEYRLDGVTIAGCGPGTAGDRPTENVTLNFGKVESSTVPGGDPDRPVVVGR